MPKHIVKLQVDDNAVFDLVAKVGDGGAALGSRLACVMLAPKDVDLRTHLGLAVYGVEVVSVEPVPEAAPAEAPTA